MLRGIGVIAVLQVLVLTPAYAACDGQRGKVIFEDTFTDDSGGWDLDPPLVTINPPEFVFALTAEDSLVHAQNLTFRATDGDFCMEAILPKRLAADNYPSVGIEFWATDYNNLMLLDLTGGGTVELYSKIDGNLQRIYAVQKAPGFKSQPGAVNALRVNTVGGKITAYLNGTQVKVVRAEVPTGEMRFGIFTAWLKDAPSYPAIKITHYKVTTGQ